VSANRGGYGVGDRIMINEVTAAGFRKIKETRPWPSGFIIRDNYLLPCLFKAEGFRRFASKARDDQDCCRQCYIMIVESGGTPDWTI
jgi:hypothetical protein